MFGEIRWLRKRWMPIGENIWRDVVTIVPEDTWLFPNDQWSFHMFVEIIDTISSHLFMSNGFKYEFEQHDYERKRGHVTTSPLPRGGWDLPFGLPITQQIQPNIDIITSDTYRSIRYV